jgi:hypothetical protein
LIAGNASDISMAMIAVTTSSSTRVKPWRARGAQRERQFRKSERTRELRRSTSRDMARLSKLRARKRSSPLLGKVKEPFCACQGSRTNILQNNSTHFSAAEAGPREFRKKYGLRRVQTFWEFARS